MLEIQQSQKDFQIFNKNSCSNQTDSYFICQGRILKIKNFTFKIIFNF